MSKDSLGDRMKNQYESRTQTYLPRRTFTIIRLDGKAFHTYTRGFTKPFDHDLIVAMQNTACSVASQIQGSKFVYTQSDEISILLTDFDNINTDAWFDGNIQKMVSISASLATSAFNQHMLNVQKATCKLANFDSRVFTIPDPVEVVNYFVWRQQDATRNSIQMLAQSLFSHKELQNLSTEKLLDKMLLEKEVNWNKLPTVYKRGSASSVLLGFKKIDYNIPIFTQDRSYIEKTWYNSK